MHLKEVDTARSVDSGWEIPEVGQGKRRRNRMGAGYGTGATRWALSDRFDRMLPPHKRYFGRSRSTLLIIILVALLCLLGLIIGLAVGLSGSKKYGMIPFSECTRLQIEGDHRTYHCQGAPRSSPATSHTTIPASAPAASTQETTTRWSRCRIIYSMMYRQAVIRIRTRCAGRRSALCESMRRLGSRLVSI